MIINKQDVDLFLNVLGQWLDKQ